MTNEGINKSFISHVKTATDAAAVVTAARTTPKLRKSCDFCCMRKRRCDGKRPCSFCVDRGRICNFSVRKPTQSFRAKNLSGHAAYHAGASQCRLGGKLQASDALLMEGDYTINDGDGPGATGVGYPLRLKRPTLSASPATGLVGLEENAFLGTFFNCLGFLPLACERTVRQGLVDTMLGARRKRAEQLRQILACEVAAPGTAGVDADAINRRGPSTPESVLPGASRSSKDEGYPRSDAAAAAAQEKHDKVHDKDDGANDSSRAAAVCELWCAIAIGALVQGQPPERVASYRFSAWTALSRCFDRIAPETARAYAVMAYLHNFLRNDKMFYRYLKMAKGIIDALSPEDTQTAQNIEQVLMKIVDARMLHTSSLNPQELGLLCESYCEDELPPLKVPSIIHKDKLCSLLIQADVKMYQAFLRDWRKHNQSAAAESDRQRKSKEGRPPLDATTPRTSDADRPSANPDVSALLKQEKGEDFSKGEGWVTPAEAASPLGSGKIGDGQACRPRFLPAPTDNVMMCVQECMELFGRMKNTAIMPEFRNGAGGLLVKAFQGFMEIRGGDKRVGARNIMECAHILVAFPGLCRFSRWSHICHCLLGFLAAMGVSELYEKLRQAYNKVLIGNAPAVPILEEWSVASVCNHIFCEDSEASVKMQTGSTRRRTEDTRSESVTVARGSNDGEAARQQQEKLEGQQQQRERQEQHQEKQCQEKRAGEHREQPRRAKVTRSESATVARGSMDGEAARKQQEKPEWQQQQRERQEQHQEKQWQENRAEKHRKQPYQEQQERQHEMDEHKKQQRQQLQQQEGQRQQQEEQRQREEKPKETHEEEQQWQQQQQLQREQQQQLQREQQHLQRQQQELQRQQLLLQRQQQQLQRHQQLQQQQDQLQRLEEQAKKHQGQQQHLQRQQQRQEQEQKQLQRHQQLQQQQDQLQRLEEQAKKHQGQQQHPQRQQQRQEQQQKQLQRQQQLQWRQQQLQRQQQLRWQQQQQQQPQRECQQHQPKREQVGMERVQEPAGVLSRQSFLRGACPEDCPTTTSLWEYEVPHRGYEVIPEFSLVCAAGSARDREPGSSSTNPQASSHDPQTVLLPAGGASPSPMQLLPIGHGVEDCYTYYHHRYGGKQNGNERYGNEHNGNELKSNDHHSGECYDGGGGVQQQQGDLPLEVWRPSPDFDSVAGPRPPPRRGLRA